MATDTIAPGNDARAANEKAWYNPGNQIIHDVRVSSTSQTRAVPSCRAGDKALGETYCNWKGATKSGQKCAITLCDLAVSQKYLAISDLNAKWLVNRSRKTSFFSARCGGLSTAQSYDASWGKYIGNLVCLFIEYWLMADGTYRVHPMELWVLLYLLHIPLSVWLTQIQLLTVWARSNTAGMQPEAWHSTRARGMPTALLILVRSYIKPIRLSYLVRVSESGLTANQQLV